MNTPHFRTGRSLGLAAALLLTRFSGAAATPADGMRSAADAFLASLSPAQKTAAVFGYGDDAQRRNWSNLPTPMVKRAGLRWGELDAGQKKAADALLKASLSPMGYRKVNEIVTAEAVLKDGSGNPPGLVFGREEFYFSFVGAPSADKPWMFQFGGHHLALNVTVAGTNGVLTPSLTCTQPAKYTLDGKTVRPLGRENDLAFELMATLDESQRKSAVLGARFRDLVLGPGQDGRTIAPEGVRVSTFGDAQKAKLLELVGEWIGILREDAAAVKMAEVKSHLDETWFAWSGPTAPGSAAYFRIQGPTVFIEYAPQNLGGDPLNHTHTILRDPTNDYGRKFGGL